ncbi:MAG: NAD-glutamate dehydrogenase [Planctomycetota bacterium]|nr:NAD-glutamate dehydrogenase [Planctomycetota bacterium]
MVSSATTQSLERARDPQTVIEELCSSIQVSAENIVPWFLRQMPRAYFEDTSDRSRVEHMLAIMAARISNTPLHLTLHGADGTTITAIREGSTTGVLAEIVGSLPMNLSLRSAKIHTSVDRSLVIDTFEFGDRPPFDGADAVLAAKAEGIVSFASKHHSDFAEGHIRAHIAKCPAEYVRTVTPLRFCRQMSLFARVSGTDAAEVKLESESDPTQSRITLTIANARTRTMLERAAIVLSHAGISVVRAYVDLIQDPPSGSVTLLGFVVQSASGEAIDPKSAQWTRASHDLMRVKWLDHTIFLFQKAHPELTVDQCEALAAFAALVHQKLCADNPFAFHRERIREVFEESLALTLKSIALFCDRFDPVKDLSDTAFATRLNSLRDEIERASDNENTSTVFKTLLDAIAAVRRTNYFVQNRFGLSCCLDPEFMVGPTRPDKPWGVYFVHGRGFNGFHVRFREIARGGLRIIHPTSTAQFEREAERLYDEVYGLASAQQQKNKDIPEGGAKCAILTELPEDSFRCIKAFTNCILDLITPEPNTKKLIRDRLGAEEILYLGPDENITPEHIDWIVANACARGYPLANAFMSSKASAGINHKEYGVTSEGVNVFLKQALLTRGIDPTVRPFTVKITGGPDGDVAGNMIRILHRDYGANARIVGIGDGSGCGEDPNGLDYPELLRLFAEGLPIASFNRARLSSAGRLVPVDAPDGALLRNTMHNRLVADAFIPSGGRPATINERNWKEFLTADGKPSSGIIVEGANLFLTPEARIHLSGAGCLIFKDSSANKCGVICSSYETQSSMLMNEAAFKKIKPVYVEQVLEKLREFALLEARCLLLESRRQSHTPLPELCVQLSRAVNDAADLIASAIAKAGPELEPMRRRVILQHIPAILFECEKERVFSVLPRAYQDWIVAKSLASRIVYQEGINFFGTLEPDQIARVVVRYLEAEELLETLLTSVRESTLADKGRIAKILERAGTRTIALGS